MINKKIIDEALNFYGIDNKYKVKCYKTLDIIKNNEEFSKAYERVSKILFEDDFLKLKELWNIKDINRLFCNKISPFITNLIILSGYEIHKKNIEEYKLNNSQIKIHKMRIKECFESDLINRKYEGVRISQMLWATYFIRIKLIEVGSLQFGYESNSIIKIHIPKNTNFNIKNIKNSIEKSKIELKKIYRIDNFRYVCNSWLLSNQLYTVINKDTNIAKFHDLFKVINGDNCLKDILNFVFNIDECNNYSDLDEKTSLQRTIKRELLNNHKFYLGVGTFK